MSKSTILIRLLLTAALLLCRVPVWAEGENDPLWNRPTYEKKVFQIGQRLLNANGITEKITFGVTYRTSDEKNNVNASAYDNYGAVFIESGLLKYIESDDELAAVLGHEIAHVLNRHGRKARNTAIATRVVMLPVLAGLSVYTGGLAAIALGPMYKGIINNVSRGQETQADLLGLQLMAQAGYKPDAMESILLKIAGDGYKKDVWRSHPSGSERLAAVHEAVQALKQAMPTASQEALKQEGVPMDSQPESAASTPINPVTLPEGQDEPEGARLSETDDIPEYLRKYMDEPDMPVTGPGQEAPVRDKAAITPSDKAPSPLDQLERLERLRQQGTLTDEEFQVLKKRIIGL